MLTWLDEGRDVALRSLLDTLPRAETSDQYAALWLGAECAELLAGDARGEASRHRLQMQARALGYQPLVTRLAHSAADGATAATGAPALRIAR